MSVDIKDHRRYLEGKLKEVQDATPVLLEQTGITNETGEPRLDKMLRAIAVCKERDEKHATDIALKGIGCVQDDMLKLQQFEYFYTKGKVDAFTEVSKVPEAILAEEKLSHRPESSIVH